MDSFDFFQKLPGITPREALGSMRASGPFDTLGIQFTCPACHILHHQSIRWYHERDYECPCGASLATPEFCARMNAAHASGLLPDGFIFRIGPHRDQQH